MVGAWGTPLKIKKIFSFLDELDHSTHYKNYKNVNYFYFVSPFRKKIFTLHRKVFSHLLLCLKFRLGSD